MPVTVRPGCVVKVRFAPIFSVAITAIVRLDSLVIRSGTARISMNVTVNMAHLDNVARMPSARTTLESTLAPVRLE